jgi:hypothetical protein
MFNPTNIIIDAYTTQLGLNYRQMYGELEPEYPNIIAFVARLALEKIANTDASYHDLNHTILVTEAGQTILKGKHLRCGQISPKDWLHFVISLLCHDIGYLRNLFAEDVDGHYKINRSGETITLPRGATDASLTPYHVERSKLFVEQRFGLVKFIDIELIQKNIEHTRFPVPDADHYQSTNDYPGLLRAADLIGQMADINYPRKVGGLYNEFNETGISQKLGYHSATDLKEAYPQFFWKQVSPLIQEAIIYLRETQEGKQLVANLYANIFSEEHHLKTFGCER